MSVGSAIEADLGKVAHAFVVGASDLKKVVIAAENAVKGAGPAITEAETIADSVVDAIYPGSQVVLTAIQGILSKVFNAIDAAGDAAAADGLNVQLDTATVAAVKAALPTVKVQAATVPGS